MVFYEHVLFNQKKFQVCIPNFENRLICSYGFGLILLYSVGKSVAITGLLESPNYCEEEEQHPKLNPLGEFMRPAGRA